MLGNFSYVKEGWGHWSDKPALEKKQISLEISKGKAIRLLRQYLLFDICSLRL
jgi:hypothetical protein